MSEAKERKNESERFAFQYSLGDIVRCVSNHDVIRVVVRVNKKLNDYPYESIGLAECNDRSRWDWSRADSWEPITFEDYLNKIIKYLRR